MMHRAAYKCPLCGSVLLYGDAKEIPYNELPTLLGMVINNQQFAGNPYLHKVPMHIPHRCPDGSAGLAAFAGFMRVSPTGRPQIGVREYRG